METGDWYSLGSLTIAAVSLLVTATVGWYSIRTARSAALDAVEAKNIAEQQVSAIERMAAVHDRLLDLSERRHAAALSDQTLPADPEVDWEIEYVSGDMYRLRNLGTAAATGVSIDPSTLPSAQNLPPGGEKIESLRSYEFYMADEMGSSIPGELKVHSDQLGESIVRVPHQG